MKIFIDTADIDEIQKAFSWGIVDGITTNPSLIKQASQRHGVDGMETYIAKILDVAGKKPVSLEVKCCSAADMYHQAKALYRRFSHAGNQVVIKVPFNPTTDAKHPIDFEGIKTIEKLSSEGIPVNVTLIFTPEQALLAAKAGATYVSPFVGRVDDWIRKRAGVKFDKHDHFDPVGIVKSGKAIKNAGLCSGLELVDDIVTIFSNYGIDTQVLAASVRNAQQVRELALVGADVVTIPIAVLDAMTQHEQTAEGLVNFLKDSVEEYDALMR